MYAENIIIDLYRTQSTCNDIVKEFTNFIMNHTSIKVLGSKIHQFDNNAITAILLLSESHISIHTWPEHDNFVAIDIMSCSPKSNYCFIDFVEELFKPEEFKIKIIKRNYYAN